LHSSHTFPTGALPTHGPLFARCRPGASLREHVAAYFSLRVCEGDPPVQVRAVPDGCCDLMFDLTQPATAWLRGPRLSAMRYEHRAPTWLLGAQLLPGTAHAFTGQSAHLVAGVAIDLAPLCVEPLHVMVRALRDVGSLASQAQQLDHFLRRRLAGRPIDRRVSMACARLESDEGQVNIGTLVSACATSERNLSRLFKRWVGLSPKQFQRVLRFQRLLQAWDRGERPGWASLAHDLGYSDQSHLVREFAAFAGVPPDALLKMP